jgi:hypothetical protein
MWNALMIFLGLREPPEIPMRYVQAKCPRCRFVSTHRIPDTGTGRFAGSCPCGVHYAIEVEAKAA